MQYVYDKGGNGVYKNGAVDEEEGVLKTNLAVLLGKPKSFKEATSPPILLDHFLEVSKLKKETLFLRTKSHSVAHPRQVLFYLLYKYTVLSLPEIGRRYGEYDHTTVMHSIGKVLERLGQHDEETTNLVMGVKKKIELAKAA